jgi:hypothetical protein
MGIVTLWIHSHYKPISRGDAIDLEKWNSHANNDPGGL